MRPSRILWMILAGILLATAHPFRWNEIEFDPNFFSFILASAGLWLLLKKATVPAKARQRFLMGFTAGLVSYAIVLFWIVIALKEFGGLSLFLAIFIALALWAYCAIYLGAWAWIAGHPSVKGQSVGLRLWLWASAWAGLEAIREYLFTGFAYGEIGYHFAHAPLISASASIWGVHGLSFFWVFLMATITEFSEWYPQRLTRRLVYGSWAIIAMVILYGRLLSFYGVETQSMRVALVQPNIEQDLKWSPEKVSEHFDKLLRLTRAAAEPSPDLIVWPETAFPVLIQNSQRTLPFSSSIPVLVGAVTGERGVNRNSALLLEGDQIKARFDKIHLVPFGEYVPLENWLPFEKLVENVGRFVPGTLDQQPLQLSSKNVKMGPLICYEDTFTRHSVRHARQGAQLLVNMTNDAWYGKSSALKQHADMAHLQVMSTGLPMVRATNTGLSSSISIYEREDFEKEVENNFFAEVNVPLEPRQSFFVLTYPFMQWIWGLIFVIALVWKFRDPTRKIFWTKSLK